MLVLLHLSDTRNRCISQDVHSVVHLQVALLSIVFTATIILGNASLRFIAVSFNQAIGATTPLFTALLSFVMQGNRESMGTYLALIPVVLGIVIATGFEPSFHMLGFLVCVSATALRGFKTVFQVLPYTVFTYFMNCHGLKFCMSCARSSLCPHCMPVHYPTSTAPTVSRTST